MDNSPLLRLPLELRNEIYEYVVTLPLSVRITVEDPNFYRLFFGRPETRTYRVTGVCPQSFRATFAISSVCHQMRQEIDSMTWSCNTFRLCESVRTEWPGQPHRSVSTFLDTIGPKATKALRRIIVETGD